MNSKNNIHQTADYHFVVCAKTAGVQILSYQTNNDGKVIWQLEDTDLLKRIQKEYYAGKLVLPVQPLFYNQKLIKSQIYA